jgi:hypothetical protein
MNFIENFLINYVLKRLLATVNVSSIFDVLIEVCFKIILKLVATLVVSSNISLFLFHCFRYLIFCIFSSSLKIFYQISFFFIKTSKFFYNQITEISLFFIELKSEYEITKHQKNMRLNRIFLDEQLILLEEWYSLNEEKTYASKILKQELANKTNLSIQQVSNWLTNKRAFVKKNQDQSNQRFSPKIRMILTKFYKENRNTDLNNSDLKSLEDETGLTQKQIKAWLAKMKFKSK